MTAFTGPLSPFAAPPRFDAAFTAWNTVASYDNYPAAQQAVERLSDTGFPVEHLDIIGSDLRLVERVIGRLTKGRAALAGALSGSWFGLLVGMLLAIFTTGTWLGLLLTGLLMGAIWGGVFGYLGHVSAGRSRDFASAKTLVATRYDLVARNGHADAARHALQHAGFATAA